MPCDLASDAPDLHGQVEKLGVHVDLLVNNAGFGLRGRFSDLPAERQAEMVRVNCEAVVTLTGAFLPAMLDRNRGGVITVASTAGMQPLPYEAVYGASKAFALNFTEALHAELRSTDVKVLAVNPGPVPTEWQQVAGYEAVGGEMMPGAIEADQVVREALAAPTTAASARWSPAASSATSCASTLPPRGRSRSPSRSGCTGRSERPGLDRALRLAGREPRVREGPLRAGPDRRHDGRPRQL